MRILLVNKFARVTGGADQHCLALADALRACGHTVALLATASPQNVETEGAFLSCCVTNASREHIGGADKARVVLSALWNRSAAHTTRELIADFQPDVVHAHKLYPQLSVAPVVTAARMRIPIVQTAHDFELVAANPLDERARWIDTRESRLSFCLLNSATYLVRRFVQLPHVARILVPSRFVARLYANRGVSTTVLPNFTEFANAKASNANGRIGIAFVGRLRAEKGVEDVLELARRLPSIPVTIAGEGALEPVVRREVLRLPNLTYVGPLDRAGVAETFRHSRVVVMPSRTPEAGPLVALEAMALGAPVVAYDRESGLAEYIRNALGGCVVRPSIDELVEACEVVHEDSVLRHRLSNSARASVARLHSSGAYVGRLESIYEEAAACAS
jgi:glycosyltransferase involved in cell wall biosynthesis